jgi:MFS family permease
MLASATGNIIGSRCGRHFGTMRGVLRIASFLGCAGLALLAALPLTAPLWAVALAMILAGAGIGMCLIGSITSAQNALGSHDIGTGTAALLVLRSVGGASGSTLAGAIIGSGLTAIHHSSMANTAVSPLHHGATVAADRAGPDLTSAPHHLAWAFATVYATAAVVAAIAWLVSLWMPNTRLRDALDVAPVSE